MQPTPEQLTAINSQLQFQRRDLMRERNLSLIGETIAEWESIRQPDDRQLLRTNHELARLLAEATEELAALKAKPSTPAPLAFPDPPHGWEWHNPESLTPEQVGIRDGWRLCLEGEARHPGFQDRIITNTWSQGAGQYDTETPLTPGISYRTKAPLPAPKPTPEEFEA